MIDGAQWQAPLGGDLFCPYIINGDGVPSVLAWTGLGVCVCTVLSVKRFLFALCLLSGAVLINKMEQCQEHTGIEKWTVILEAVS